MCDCYQQRDVMFAVRQFGTRREAELGELTAPRLAPMVAEPTLVAAARPAEPAVLLTLATPGSDDTQVTIEVRSFLELSL